MSFKLPLFKSRENAKNDVHAVPNLGSFKKKKLIRNVCLEKEASDMYMLVSKRAKLLWSRKLKDKQINERLTYL